MRTVALALILAACTGGSDPADGRPVLVWSTDLLQFGEVPVGQTATQTVQLLNDGGGQIELLTASRVEGDPARWAVSWEGGTLGPGQATDLTVEFQPAQPEDRAAAQFLIRAQADGLEAVVVRAFGQGAPSTADEDGDGWTVAEGDCDDGDMHRYPGAPERCNGLDDDCDGAPDPDEVDADNDGVRVCDGDCDDSNAQVYPGAPEICDGLDSDCDGINQDEADADGDGFSVCDGDCDDSTAAASPAGTEVCGDGLDNDCDGTVDVVDLDGDGHDVCSAAGDCDDADPDAYPRVVSPSGSAGAPGSASAPLADLAEAVATLDAVCRTIYLTAGTHPGAGLVWEAGELTVVGLGAAAGDVVIDAAGTDRHLDLTGGEVELRRLTLRGGSAPAGQGGGAVRIGPGATLSLVGAALDANHSDQSGGALHVAGSLAISGGATFTANTAARGGAVAVVGGNLFDPGLSVYQDNQATESGGGLWANGPVLLTGALFQGNTAAHGGGLALAGGSGHTVQRARFWSNVASGDGGGLWVNDTTGAVIRNHRVQDNSAGGAGGGAWLGPTAVATLSNNTFTANASTQPGAALHVAGDAAVATANLAHFHDGPSAVHAPDGSLAVISHTTAFATSTGVDFSGALAPDTDQNTVQNPAFVAFTDNDDPSDDDLTLQPGSPAIDTGPPGSPDPDGTPNDRGHTGGPGAL